MWHRPSMSRSGAECRGCENLQMAFSLMLLHMYYFKTILLNSIEVNGDERGLLESS